MNIIVWKAYFALKHFHTPQVRISFCKRNPRFGKISIWMLMYAQYTTGRTAIENKVYASNKSQHIDVLISPTLPFLKFLIPIFNVQWETSMSQFPCDQMALILCVHRVKCAHICNAVHAEYIYKNTLQNIS